MKKYSMRAVPAAAAMVAALVFGVQVHAQTATSMPPGSTNPKDASTTPGPAARAAANGTSSTVTSSTGTSSTGTSSTGSTSAGSTSAGNTGAGKPTVDGVTMPPGSTKPKDALNPKAETATTAEQRAMAKSDRAAAKADKRAAQDSKKKTGTNNSAETPGGSMSSTATSPSK